MNTEVIRQAIDKAINENKRFYAYRLPSDDEIHFGLENNSDSEVVENFLIYPFQVSAHNCPAVIHSQSGAEDFIKAKTSVNKISNNCPYTDSFSKDEYIKVINDIKKRIANNEFNKIVLSNVIEKHDSDILSRLSAIFLNLTAENPNAFVFIYNTEETGLWIGATPETLLISKAGKATTMALAGTRLANTEGNWGNKELDEQQFVCDYICDIFEKENIPYHVSEKFTKQAGNIEHICNIINTDSINSEQTKRIIDKLHPTPAIAGLPKIKAIEYLNSVEKHDRKCYGGYLGVISNDYSSCSLFVNLRSMQVFRETCHIFVGGGITIDSDPESEWKEIQRKANFLLKQLNK